MSIIKPQFQLKHCIPWYYQTVTTKIAHCYSIMVVVVYMHFQQTKSGRL